MSHNQVIVALHALNDAELDGAELYFSKLAGVALMAHDDHQRNAAHDIEAGGSNG